MDAGRLSAWCREWKPAGMVLVGLLSVGVGLLSVVITLGVHGASLVSSLDAARDQLVVNQAVNRQILETTERRLTLAEGALRRLERCCMEVRWRGGPEVINSDRGE